MFDTKVRYRILDLDFPSPVWWDKWYLIFDLDFPSHLQWDILYLTWISPPLYSEISDIWLGFPLPFTVRYLIFDLDFPSHLQWDIWYLTGISSTLYSDIWYLTWISSPIYSEIYDIWLGFPLPFTVRYMIFDWDFLYPIQWHMIFDLDFLSPLQWDIWYLTGISSTLYSDIWYLTWISSPRYSEIYGLGPKDVVLQASPLTFDPSVVEIFTTLSCGASLVIVPESLKQVPQTLVEVLIRQRVSLLQVRHFLFYRSDMYTPYNNYILWFALFSRGLFFMHFHFKTIRSLLKFTHIDFV